MCKCLTVLEFDWWEGGTRAYNLLLLPLETRNCKFLPRAGGPTLGWAPKTQRKGFSGNSRAGLRGAGCLAFVPEAGSSSEGRGECGAQALSGAHRGPHDSSQFCAALYSEQEATHARKRARRAYAQTLDWPQIAELVEQVTLPPQASVSPSITWD